MFITSRHNNTYYLKHREKQASIDIDIVKLFTFREFFQNFAVLAWYWLY